MCDNIKVFQGPSIQKYSQSVPLLREKFNERCQDFEVTELEFLPFASPLRAGIEKAPENPKMELFNSLCDTNLNHQFSETNCNTFIAICQKKYFLC
jgi:hypothetical protein